MPGNDKYFKAANQFYIIFHGKEEIKRQLNFLKILAHSGMFCKR
jgi:hypothetical protein